MPDDRRPPAFSIRAEPGAPPRAVLQVGAPGTPPLVLEEAALRRRIEAARGAGEETASDEAALAALRRIAAARDRLADASLPVVSDAPWRASVLAAAVEASREGLILATAGAMARIVYANPAFGRMAGAPPERLLGKDPAALLPGIGEGQARRLGLRRLDGGTSAVDAVPVPLRPETGGRLPSHVAWLLRPAAGSAAADPLTGLPLRATVEAALEGALDAAAMLRHARGPCAAWLQAERLAQAGPGGSATRDAVLIGLAERLAENLRRIDVLAHAGDGAFPLCLPRVSLLEARAIVSRLRAAVAAAPFDTPAGPLALRLRSGIAAAPAADAQSMLEAARRAAGTRAVPVLPPR